MESLGKGLESLIPDKLPEEILDTKEAGDSPPSFVTEENQEPKLPASAPEKSAAPARTYQDHFIPRRGESIFWVEVDKVEPNPYQPRQEFSEEALRGLAGSIREHGVLQPILLSKREIDTPTGLEVRYQLIAGERRWRAAKLAGLSQVPAVIRRGVPDDRLKLELALIENLQREDLNGIERAKAFKQLVDEFHLVQREIAARIGKSREAVTNTLRLLSLPQEIQDAVARSAINEGHARAILMVGDDTSKQLAVYRGILDDKLNVREAENRARQVGERQLRPKPRAYRVQDPEMREVQSRLQEVFGTKVRLERLGERGKIVMEFYSEEEMRGILDKLTRWA